MGIGDWGLGIGPIPNPQSPIPYLIIKLTKHNILTILLIIHYYILNCKFLSTNNIILLHFNKIILIKLNGLKIQKNK